MEQSRLSQIDQEMNKILGEYEFQAKRISHPYYTSKLRSDDEIVIQEAKTKMFKMHISIRKLQKEKSKILAQQN